MRNSLPSRDRASRTAELGLVRVVREDLEYITSRWPTADLSEDELRRSSTILRRFLTYDDLRQVWESVFPNKAYLVPTNEIEVVDQLRLTQVEFAISSPVYGGPGPHLHAAIVYNRIQSDNDPIRIGAERYRSLCKFIFTKVLVANGVLVSRNDIVQYVANKMGGAHFDETLQKPSEKALRAIAPYYLGNRQAVMHEMLSTGQMLSKAEDTMNLLQALRA